MTDKPMDTESVLERVKQAIGKVFIPSGVWNIEEGWKLEKAAKAAIAASSLIEEVQRLRKELAIASAMPWIKPYHCNGERILQWIDGPKRTASDAFTAGLERDIVYRFEALRQDNELLMAETKRKGAALSEAIAAYGRPGGPWNLYSDPGGWLTRAREALGGDGSMTIYTHEQLEAMSDRELDSLVHSRVMGKKGKPDWEGHYDPGVDYNPLHYSTTWEGFGLLVERMRKLGFKWAVQLDTVGSTNELRYKSTWVCFEQSMDDSASGVCKFDKENGLFKAAAIAAVLAVQEVA